MDAWRNNNARYARKKDYYSIFWLKFWWKLKNIRKFKILVIQLYKFLLFRNKVFFILLNWPKLLDHSVYPIYRYTCGDVDRKRVGDEV